MKVSARVGVSDYGDIKGTQNAMQGSGRVTGCHEEGVPGRVGVRWAPQNRVVLTLGDDQDF